MTDRRTDTSEVTKVRRTNWMLIFVVMLLASVMLTLAILLWDINERQKEREADKHINEYLNCLSLFASGVSEKTCEKYRVWVERHTNVVVPR